MMLSTSTRQPFDLQSASRRLPCCKRGGWQLDSCAWPPSVIRPSAATVKEKMFQY
jgi:hypothetical protein